MSERQDVNDLNIVATELNIYTGKMIVEGMSSTAMVLEGILYSIIIII